MFRLTFGLTNVTLSDNIVYLSILPNFLRYCKSSFGIFRPEWFTIEASGRGKKKEKKGGEVCEAPETVGAESSFRFYNALRTSGARHSSLPRTLRKW